MNDECNTPSLAELRIKELEQKLSEAQGRTFAMENKFNKMVNQLAESEQLLKQTMTYPGATFLEWCETKDKLSEALEVIRDVHYHFFHDHDYGKAKDTVKSFINKHDSKPSSAETI